MACNHSVNRTGRGHCGVDYIEQSMLTVTVKKLFGIVQLTTATLIIKSRLDQVFHTAQLRKTATTLCLQLICISDYIGSIKVSRSFRGILARAASFTHFFRAAYYTYSVIHLSIIRNKRHSKNTFYRLQRFILVL